MSNIDIFNLVFALIAIVISLASIIWTIVSHSKDKSHEFYSIINEDLRMLIFNNIPNKLNRFVDIKTKNVFQEQYNDLSDSLMDIIYRLQSIRYVDQKAFDNFVEAITDFDELCIVIANDCKISERNLKKLFVQNEKLFKLAKKFFKKH